MSSKKTKSKKDINFKNLESAIPKKLKLIKFKVNPSSFFEETKNKIGNFYSNLKKEREKEKKKIGK